jgi:hypothetical protein
MAEGSTFKRCSCRNGDGKELGQKCPKLRRPGGGWNHRHGIWHYQIELPPRPDGKRRGPLRRGGFTSQDDAEAELAQVRGGSPQSMDTGCHAASSTLSMVCCS